MTDATAPALAAAPEKESRKDRVVIVMPAYNAARTLEDTFRAIPEGYYDEIVVVDDFSRDDTKARRPAPQPEGDPPSPQRRLRRQPEDLLHGGPARRGRASWSCSTPTASTIRRSSRR